MRIYRPLLAACLFLAVVSAVAGDAQAQASPKPFSKDEVVKLLTGVPVKRVETLVREHGIDFQITPETELELRKAGATDPLLTTLRDLAPKQLPPAAPPSLVIQSTPGGAHVYVDDVAVGTTSSEGRLIILTLSPGQHTVRLSLDGYSDYQRSIHLVSGQTTEVPGSLEEAGRRSTKASIAQPVTPSTISGNSESTLPYTPPEITKMAVESYDLLHESGVHYHPGTLFISRNSIRWEESGRDAHSEDNFSVSCAEVRKAGKMGGLSGIDPFFTIHLAHRTYNFPAPNHDWSYIKLLTDSVSRACGK